jgi:ATP-dependent RNA helicase
MVESTTSNSTQKKAENAAAEDEDMIIESSEKIELITSFDELKLNEQLLRGLYAYGFSKPSAV